MDHIINYLRQGIKEHTSFEDAKNRLITMACV